MGRYIVELLEVPDLAYRRDLALLGEYFHSHILRS